MASLRAPSVAHEDLLHFAATDATEPARGWRAVACLRCVQSGGVMRVRYGEVTFSDCKFSGNHAGTVSERGW